MARRASFANPATTTAGALLVGASLAALGPACGAPREPEAPPQPGER
ncbi:MAG: hypothetical protein HY908_28505, partial [Myxococcales bacterium]|nr:hypothetical protein [Myxococcales bacterium]